MIKQCIKCNIEKDETLYERYKYLNVKGEVIYNRTNICKECRRKRFKELYYDTGVWSERYSNGAKSTRKASIRQEYKGAVINIDGRKIWTDNVTDDDIHFLWCKGYGFIIKNYKYNNDM